MKENPQNEVLQPQIKTEKALQHYFIGSAIAIDYTSYLEQVCGQKFGSIEDPCTIQAPLMKPLWVFSKTPCKSCRYEI